MPVRPSVQSACVAARCVCENLIHALKLLANQQKDCDSPIQSIVIGLCERSRKGMKQGLRRIIKVDNHCALDVGHLNEGMRLFEVRRQKFKEERPEASIREERRKLAPRNRASMSIT